MSKIKYELINYCEFDKYASKAYSLIHNESEDKNLGDITKINEKNISDFNMMVGGSPCQDFSVAGKQEGAKWTCKDCNYEYNPLEAHYSTRDKCPKCSSINIEKTRSSLLVEWLRILKEKKPNMAIYENVKNIVGKQFKQTFNLFESELKDYGYNTYWKVLNAKDYGIPQNRERVYLIIIKKELDNSKFKFPIGFDSGLRLKDFLEDKVYEKYYLSNKGFKYVTNESRLNKMITQVDGDTALCITAKGNNNWTGTFISNKDIIKVGQVSSEGSQGGMVYSSDGVFPCITAGTHGYGMGNILEDNKLKQIGILDIKGNDSIKRVYSDEGISPTLTTMEGGNRQPKILEESPTPELIGGIGEINFGKQYRQGNRVYSSDKTAMCLLSQPVGNAGGNSYLYQLPDYRIRKLTPKECLRLMGFSDSDYYILENNNISNSQIYKMAGNSIVVDVLYHILFEVYKVMPYLFEDIKLGSFFSGIGAFEKAILKLQKNIENITH
jgi:DNA (cytosine-5)-methyltransferase 1